MKDLIDYCIAGKSYRYSYCTQLCLQHTSICSVLIDADTLTKHTNAL